MKTMVHPDARKRAEAWRIISQWLETASRLAAKMGRSLDTPYSTVEEVVELGQKFSAAIVAIQGYLPICDGTAPMPKGMAR